MNCPIYRQNYPFLLYLLFRGLKAGNGMKQRLIFLFALLTISVSYAGQLCITNNSDVMVAVKMANNEPFPISQLTMNRCFDIPSDQADIRVVPTTGANTFLGCIKPGNIKADKKMTLAINGSGSDITCQWSN